MIDAELPSSSAEECRENGVLLSLSRLGGEGVLTDLAVRFRDVFARTFDIGPKAGRGAMEQALFELGDNAATHGASDYGAYVAAQRCASGRCMLAVGDTGVGIPAHMRRSHGADASDGAAIEHAMRMRTTGTPDLDRGVGYGGIIREMTKVEVPEARLRIWSGGARHSFVVCRGAVREQRTEESVSPTVGTWVSFEVHLGAEGARFEFRR
jgi:hypothetical protein